MSEKTPVMLKTSAGSATMFGVMDSVTQLVRVRLTAEEAEEDLTRQLIASELFWTIERLNRFGWNVLPLTRIG